MPHPVDPQLTLATLLWLACKNLKLILVPCEVVEDPINAMYTLIRRPILNLDPPTYENSLVERSAILRRDIRLRRSTCGVSCTASPRATAAIAPV